MPYCYRLIENTFILEVGDECLILFFIYFVQCQLKGLMFRRARFDLHAVLPKTYYSLAILKIYSIILPIRCSLDNNTNWTKKRSPQFWMLFCPDIRDASTTHGSEIL